MENEKNKSLIVICACTYKRPKGLRRLLDGLSLIAVPFDADFAVVIVDNDVEGTADLTCTSLRSSFPWPLHCISEPQRGIPFARNRAVKMAMSLEATFIAFIDDDEVPSQDWLVELLTVQRFTDADAVGGPVRARFPSVMQDNPLAHASFYDYTGPLPGAVMKEFATNNLILRAEALKEIEGPFDESLGLMGCDDSLLARVLYNRGATLKWAPEALVYEDIPESRINAMWLIKRAFRYGNSFAFIEHLIRPSFLLKIVRILKATRRIIIGLLKLPTALRHDHANLVHALQLCFRGFGEIMGVFGYKYLEYKQTHGT